MNSLLIAITVLLSAALVALTIGVVVCARRMTQAVRSLDATLIEIRREVVPLAQDVRTVLANIDALVSSTRTTVETAGRTAGVIERLVDGRTIAEAASKFAGASKSTLAILLEGAKEAVRAFKAAKPQRTETGERSEKAG